MATVTFTKAIWVYSGTTVSRGQRARSGILDGEVLVLVGMHVFDTASGARLEG